jgi:hypothetical protein
MQTYIVPAIMRKHPAGYQYRTANVEPGVSWVGQPIGNGDRYLIRTSEDLPELPPGRERGERARLNAQQVRETAQSNGIDPDEIAQRWFVRGAD